jgi:hypothetical protein
MGHMNGGPNHHRGHSIPVNQPQSPSKRQNIHTNNGILLPELIINKNKINFGAKSFKIDVDS